MTMTTDAPPSAPPGAADRGMENAILALAAEVRTMAESLSQMAAAFLASQGAPGASRPPTASPGPSMPPVAAPAASPGPPAATGERERKMGSKVYAICIPNGWDIPATGETITGHTMAKDSRTWSFADLTKVLDQFSAWGFP